MLPFKGHHPLRVFIPRKPHPNGFLIYLVCVRLDDGRTVGIEFRFDSDSSGTVDRCPPTEILASVSRTPREDFNLGGTPLVAYNDAAFGGPLGQISVPAIEFLQSTRPLGQPYTLCSRPSRPTCLVGVTMLS